MYSLFRELPNEQEMYQAIASVGNMLLKLGEFGGELDTNVEKTAGQQSKSDDLDQFIDPLHVAELESSSASTIDLLPGPSEVTVTSELESSTLMKEALMDAARSSESSLSSPVRSSTGDDFVLVGSDEGFSTPEPVVSETNTQDTLHEVYNKLSLGDPLSVVDTAAESNTVDQKDYNSRLLVVKRGHHPTEVVGFNKRNGQSNESPSSGALHTTQSHVRHSSGSSDIDQSNDGPSSGALDTDQSNERSSSGALDLDWSICFEQFLASMSTEPYLVHYFDETVDVIQRLKKMKTEGIGSFRNTSRTNLNSAE